MVGRWYSEGIRRLTSHCERADDFDQRGLCPFPETSKYNRRGSILTISSQFFAVIVGGNGLRAHTSSTGCLQHGKLRFVLGPPGCVFGERVWLLRYETHITTGDHSE